MSGPPPPPKRKNHKAIATYGDGAPIAVAVGSGHNVVRAINENNQKVAQSSRNNVAAQYSKPKNRICMMEDVPDAIIGAGVEIHGEFQFDRLLRIDGKFQGTLLSQNRGDLIIGKHGCIIGDVIIARRMIVEGGHVIGKVVVDELLLQDHTIVKGDITCKLIEIQGPHVTITGRANIHALAPELVDEYDNIITEVPKVMLRVMISVCHFPNITGVNAYSVIYATVKF